MPDDSQEAQDQIDEQAFEAGFNNTRGDEPHVETRPQDDAQTEVAAPESTVATAEEAPPVEVPLFAGYTEAQVKSMFEKLNGIDGIRESVTKTHDKAFGRIGELQQTIKALQENPSARKPVKVKAEDLKRTSAEFKELAEFLAEDLSELSLGSGPASVDQEQIDTFNQKLEELSLKTEATLLKIEHPDWRQHRQSQEFATWLNLLKPEISDEIQYSNDSAYLSGAFTEFKRWKAGNEEVARPPVAATETTKQKNDKRLAAAVTPQGVPSAGPSIISDNAGLNAGFSKVRKKI